MKSLTLFCTLALVCGSSHAAERPNIVVILADDLGFSDIGCYGSEIPTPNLDRLAADGLRFTQFYNTPRCSPTRAALLTGLYSQQAGMGWLDGKVVPNSRGFHGKLLPRCVTIAEVLGEAGYFTAMTGKWHLGQQNGTPPWKRGFMRSLNSQFGEVYFPKESPTSPAPRISISTAARFPRIRPSWATTGIRTDLFTDWGLKFIDEARAEKKPFFLYIAQGAVHFPLRAPADVIAHYRGKYMTGWDKLREERHARQIEMGIVDAGWPLSPRPGESPAWDTRTPEQQDRFDCDHGRLCRDDRMPRPQHGPAGRRPATARPARQHADRVPERQRRQRRRRARRHHRGRRARSAARSRACCLGMNWATLANTPFCRYKHFTHEGGISSPFIAHWPAGIAAERRGSLERQPAHLIDIMATAVDLAGANYPAEFQGNAILPMEGVSLRPAFEGQPLNASEPIFWEHEGNKAVRDGRWKLVQKWRGPWELYDMEADRTEQHDLIAEQPEVAARLETAWNDWAARAFVDDWPGPDHTDWGQDIPVKK